MSECVQLENGPTGCGPVTGHISDLKPVTKELLKSFFDQLPNAWKDTPLILSPEAVKVYEEYLREQYPLGFEGMDANPMALRTQLEDAKHGLNIVVPGLEVPPDKLKAMQDFAKALRKKYPKWKPPRITKKVCDHFKIKLVPHADK